MSFCPHCGNSITSTAKFCGSCGKPVEVGELSSLPQTSRSSISGNGGRLSTAPGDIAVAISHTIFVAPISFLNPLDKILSDKGVAPHSIVGATGTSEEIHQKILEKISTSSQKKIQYVCLIGDWDNVPPFRVPAPEPSDPYDDDKFCQSDAFYGCISGYNEADIQTAIPQLYVGRIPSISVEIVTKTLFAKLDEIDVRASFSLAVSAQAWKIPTQTIVNHFLGTPAIDRLAEDPKTGIAEESSVLLCPAWYEAELKEAMPKCVSKPNSVILFNVHGGPDEPYWTGQPQNAREYPKIFEPKTVDNYNSALVVSEACYGGALEYPSISIVESFFEKNGISFVGSSTIAYGNPQTEDIFAADVIALTYLQCLGEGKTAGQSLNEAKKKVFSMMDPLSQFESKKTILSFNLFGTPWYTRQKSPSISMPRDLRSNSDSLVDEIRNRSRVLNIDQNDVIGNIRARYQSALPEKNKQYLLGTQEAREKIRRFKDFDKINELLEDWSSSPDSYVLQFLSNGVDEGYSLYSGDDSIDGKSKNILVFYLDAAGSIKRTLTSKGMI